MNELERFEHLWKLNLFTVIEKSTGHKEKYDSSRVKLERLEIGLLGGQVKELKVISLEQFQRFDHFVFYDNGINYDIFEFGQFLKIKPMNDLNFPLIKKSSIRYAFLIETHCNQKFKVLVVDDLKNCEYKLSFNHEL